MGRESQEGLFASAEPPASRRPPRNLPRSPHPSVACLPMSRGPAATPVPGETQMGRYEPRTRARRRQPSGRIAAETLPEQAPTCLPPASHRPPTIRVPPTSHLNRRSSREKREYLRPTTSLCTGEMDRIALGSPKVVAMRPVEHTETVSLLATLIRERRLRRQSKCSTLPEGSAKRQQPASREG